MVRGNLAEELLKLREDVIYDALYGRQYITDAMNEPVQQP